MRKCQHCRKALIRGNNGYPEARHRFEKRKFCDSDCRKAHDATRYCQNPHCGKELKRKVWKSGGLETLAFFKKRKHCDGQCAAFGRHRPETFECGSKSVCNATQRDVMEVIQAWR